MRGDARSGEPDGGSQQQRAVAEQQGGHARHDRERVKAHGDSLILAAMVPGSWCACLLIFAGDIQGRSSRVWKIRKT